MTSLASGPLLSVKILPARPSPSHNEPSSERVSQPYFVTHAHVRRTLHARACAVLVHANAPRIRKANAGCNTECTLPHYHTLHMPKRAHRTLSSEFLFFSWHPPPQPPATHPRHGRPRRWDPRGLGRTPRLVLSQNAQGLRCWEGS